MVCKLIIHTEDKDHYRSMLLRMREMATLVSHKEEAPCELFVTDGEQLKIHQTFFNHSVEGGTVPPEDQSPTS